jgi:hypothetical protein
MDYTAKVEIPVWQLEQYRKYVKEAIAVIAELSPAIQCENDAALAKIHGRMIYLSGSLSANIVS